MFDNEVEQIEQDTVETVAEETPVAQPEQQESNAEYNFRQLREKAERLERERDEYARQMQSMQQPKEPEQEEDISIRPDELVEGKHLSAYEKKIKKLEQKLHQQAQYSAAQNAEAMVRLEMPDFDKVVNKESIKELQSQYPELAASIASNNDLHGKAKAAYQAITKLGISKDYSRENEAINRNNNRPRPSASIAPTKGNSPLDQADRFANGLTQDVKDQLYKEALDAINSR